MKYKNTANLLKYIVLAIFIVIPGLSINGQTADEAKTGQKMKRKILPPIDREMPTVFDTATFGLG